MFLFSQQGHRLIWILNNFEEKHLKNLLSNQIDYFQAFVELMRLVDKQYARFRRFKKSLSPILL